MTQTIFNFYFVIMDNTETPVGMLFQKAEDYSKTTI